jgi:hypothetical protein
MGINTGNCNVGNFGSAARMDYTIRPYSCRIAQGSFSFGKVPIAPVASGQQSKIRVSRRLPLVLALLGPAEPITGPAVFGRA